MVSPWELLGLEAGADTRSIKRRYAQLLKQTRPDEDPEAFQRLREAYEWALDWAQRSPDVDAPVALDESVTPVPFSDAQQPIASLAEIQQNDDRAWVAALLDSCTSLDDALFQAREAGQQRVFELELLRRAQLPGDQADETVRWAMAHLNWLTPWQADYLPIAAMSAPAERLLNAELWKWHSQLEDGQEQAVLESIRQLKQQPWVQPFDRSSYLQQGVLGLLESNLGWSLNFFDETCRLFDWDEARGQLPCDDLRWELLCSRSASMALRAELSYSLSQEPPVSPSSRAAWLLLKPMREGKRRELVDGFKDADWQACEALALRLERHGDAVDDQGLVYLQQWRDWHPGSGWNQLYLLLWLGLCLVLLVLSSGASESPKDLAISVGVVATASAAFVFVFRLLAKAWNRLASWCVVIDVGISRRLIPERWIRGGSGLLLLRHIVPSAAFAALTANWPASPIASTVLALTTFILCVQFLDVASRGRAPAAWLILAWRLLAPLGKQILIWIVILVMAFVLSKMIIASKHKEREAQALQPSSLLAACKILGYTSREECMHPGRASKARRSSGETPSQTQD
ncbi:J domain-containing protein [Pseudomonas sp. CNPSo 3701]|uniref:J domain-containing protein n=1 Tax=Pseudomonas sp. CNPSo 3701 TaxID=3027943 RepID=UPI0023636CD2|nr:J domain-containing protein [Pseudomonas sp. CNPSo 3701]MDD1506613.1 J domain-containing protein [Pseudomonas sp. CNPSo 3701]